MWAMNDFTEENGATRVIPGSNHWDDKLRLRARPDDPGGDAEGLGAALPRLAVPRRRCEPLGRAAARHQRRLHAVVVAPGGEPVPRVPARGRTRAARSARAARGLPSAARTRSATTATCTIRSTRCVAATAARLRAFRTSRSYRYAAAWIAYRSAYCPWCAISSSCVPTSTTRAPSSTTIRSAMRTVEKRCDTRIVMRPLRRRRRRAPPRRSARTARARSRRRARRSARRARAAAARRA